MSDHPIKSPRKLIEVALPLDAINKACAREKTIKYGHPVSRSRQKDPLAGGPGPGAGWEVFGRCRTILRVPG